MYSKDEEFFVEEKMDSKPCKSLCESAQPHAFSFISEEAYGEFLR